MLAGDVMTGRGIDQALDHPVDPRLYEPVVTDAREYVTLAETENGLIHRPLPEDYIWGDALALAEERALHARIANLETANTGRNWRRCISRGWPRTTGAWWVWKSRRCASAISAWNTPAKPTPRGWPKP